MPKVLVWTRIKNKWLPDGTQPEGYTYRAPVPGGWLVSVWAGDDKTQVWGGGLTFVEDKDHAWEALEIKRRKRRN